MIMTTIGTFLVLARFQLTLLANDMHELIWASHSMKIHTARSLHPILKLREAGQEEDGDSPVVTQLQGCWGKNVTPSPCASKSVLLLF